MYKILTVLIFTLCLVCLNQNGFANLSADQVKEYQASAEQGNVAAQILLADCYANGNGVEQDSEKAAHWYKIAAEQGDPLAQYMLGKCFMSGKGVEKNQRESIKLYHQAAEQGLMEAEFMLGACYAAGHTLPQDYGKAVAWYQKAANSGHSGAQHQLGVMYKAGQGVEKDDIKALKLFRKSAEQGFPGGQFAYGVSVFSGKGTPKDMVEGYKWIYLAAKQGYETAIDTLPKVEKLISKQEILKAQKSAQSFEPISLSETRDYEPGSSVGQLGPKATGTGFFITDNGFLVTNGHVVQGVSEVRLGTKAGLISAKVLKVDKANDFALLKAEGNFDALPVIASRSIKLGASVATVGFPNINMQGFSPKLAKGEVASLSGAADDPRFFQVSVPVQPGNSGGALVDERGNVVGVVSAKLDAATALETSGALPENVNYALKSSFLLGFLESVPDVASAMKEPNFKEDSFEGVVASVERASVLVLVP